MKKLLLIIVILLGAGGYYGYQYWQEKQEARRKAEEEETRRKTEEEAKRKAEEEEARRKTEEEAKRKAEEEEARRRAEEARKAAWLLAEEYTGKEKIRIVSAIVKAKVRESRKNGTAQEKEVLLSRILEAVYNVMPLDVNNSLQLSPEVIAQQKEQVQNKYPADDEELQKRYRAEAETMFSVYQPGEEVTVYYRVHGGKLDKVSGKFYRADPDHVWIGTKKISRASLSEDDVPRFDPVLAERLREKYIARGIINYHRRRVVFQKTLADDAIHELRGYVKYRGRWLSVRKLVVQRFREIAEEKPRKTINSSSRPQTTNVRVSREQKKGEKREETSRMIDYWFRRGPVLIGCEWCNWTGYVMRNGIRVHCQSCGGPFRKRGVRSYHRFRKRPGGVKINGNYY